MGMLLYEAYAALCCIGVCMLFFMLGVLLLVYTGMLVHGPCCILGDVMLVNIVSMVPFGQWRVSVLSCGSGFYLMNIVIGLCALVVFCCVSRKYKHRQMDEPSHEYRYAEAYYSNVQ